MVREATPGTTPDTPRMRLVRLTGESLSFTPDYIDSAEIRSDRMLDQAIKVMQASQGGINFELSYPDDNSPASEIYRSAFFSAWVNTPTFDNDGTADSVITDAGTTTDTYAVASGGAAVVAGHLVRATGFTNSANNQVFKAVSSTATTIVGSSLSLTAETAPPATAKLKVIGVEGASGDITATSTGLGSTSLDFTTLGLAVGQLLLVGGSATANKFATAANNGAYIRITAITATALTCDNLPTGWTTDSGTGKTIRIGFGDQIKNGVDATSLSIEKGFMDQSVPTYIVNTGMQVNTIQHSITSRQVVSGQAAFLGMGGSEGTTSLDDSPDAATPGKVMAANANVGRIAENGSRLTDPNWARQLTFTINNNLRTVEAADEDSPVKINPGECTVTGTIETYFGDDTLLQKLYNGTLTSIITRITKNNQSLIWQFPKVTLRTGVPAAQAKNQDVTLPSNFSASIDTLTNALVLLDRFEYVGF